MVLYKLTGVIVFEIGLEDELHISCLSDAASVKTNGTNQSNNP